MSRDRVAAVLLTFAAVGAAGAGLTTLVSLGDAQGEARVSELWHGWGLLFFAGVFVLLARAPRAYSGLWFLVVANKVALTMSLAWLAVASGSSEALTSALVDGALTVLLVVALVITREVRPSYVPGADRERAASPEHAATSS